MGRRQLCKVRASEKARNANSKRITHGAKHKSRGEAGLDGDYWELPAAKRHERDAVAAEMKCTGCSEHIREGRGHEAAEHCATRKAATDNGEKVDRAVRALVAVGDAREKIRRKRRVTAKDMRRVVKRVGVSLSTYYRLRKRALGGTIRRKAGSGRRATVAVNSVHNWLKQFIRQHHGFVTIAQVVDAMK